MSSAAGTGAGRLALGTAQLGLDYGITNAAGQVPESEARELLRICAEAGITTIDTASAYGDSEAVIGRARPPKAHFDIVTKTPALAGAGSATAAGEMVRHAFERSLDALRAPQLAALLVHQAGDLLGPLGDGIWKALEALKAQGRVAKIGVSAYDGAEIDALLDRFPIEIIQLPYNILDRRLVESGHLQRLAELKVEVHARSLFLQGLLLAPPATISDRFAPVRDAVESLDRHFAAAGRSRLEGLLADAFQQPAIARFVCGVTDTAQLNALVAAAGKAENLPPVVNLLLSRIDNRYLLPAGWQDLQ